MFVGEICRGKKLHCINHLTIQRSLKTFSYFCNLEGAPRPYFQNPQFKHCIIITENIKRPKCS